MRPRVRVFAILFCVLPWCLLVGSVLSTADFWVGAFGASGPAGLPTPLVAALAAGLLGLPLPWVTWHALLVARRAHALGLPLGGAGFLYTLWVLPRHAPELHRSRVVVIAGFLYFLGFMGAWIACAAARCI